MTSASTCAAARAAETGTSHILLEAAPQIANTIYRYQKGKHVMATPVSLTLRSDCEFDAGKREAILDKCRKVASLDEALAHPRDAQKDLEALPIETAAELVAA